MPNVKPIPDGYHNVTPYLFIRGAGAAVDFYKKVFGAKELMRIPGPIGQVMHAELRIGDSIIMLSDENPKMGAMSPQTAGGISMSLHLYMENVDAVVQKAVDEGAKLIRPVQNQFYGDRTGTVIDPFGHMWSVATHVEDVAPDEMQRRMAAATKQAAHGTSAGS
jgi:PhnB protein